MKNYTIIPTGTANIFTLEDENGKPVADVRGHDMANVFAHVPELLSLLDSCVDVNLPFAYSDAVDLQEKLKHFRT